MKIFLDSRSHFEDHQITCGRAKNGAVAVGQPKLPQGNQEPQSRARVMPSKSIA
jgi:hypothetical protein